MTGGGLEQVSKRGASGAEKNSEKSRQEQPICHSSGTSLKKEGGVKTSISGPPDSVWVFGYGSLLWKINFPFEDKVVGHVKGFARRFWQGSTDHRGVPGAPGRVVTLIEASEEETWGVAYKVQPSDVPDVMAYLDHRERGGYTTHEVVFHPRHYRGRLNGDHQNKQHPQCDPKATTTFTVLAYIATELNPNYLGPAPVDDLAKQVVDSRGPSGCNSEYILNLAEAMREIAPGVEDDHLFSLEGKVREQLEVKLKVKVERVISKGGECTSTAMSTAEALVHVDCECTCNFCYCITESAATAKTD